MIELFWVDIFGYEGKYKISDKGDIISLPRKHTGVNPVTIKIGESWDGYKCVLLSNNGKRKMLRVHRLVLSSFLKKNLDPYLVVNHIDGDKHNNSLHNLEEVSHSVNAFHAYSMGLRKANGENNGKSKITNNVVLEIKKDLLYGLRVVEIVKKYGVHQTTVSHIKSGKMWGSVTGWNINNNFYNL